MKNESIDILKQSLCQIILKDGVDILDGFDTTYIERFEANCNLIEIISNLLNDDEMIYLRSTCKEKTPFSMFFTAIDKITSKISEYKSDDKYKFSDDYFDDVQDKAFMNVTNYFAQIYLNYSVSEVEKMKNLEEFQDNMAHQLIERLNSFEKSSDFTKKQTFKNSELRLYTLYIYILIKGLKRDVLDLQKIKSKLSLENLNQDLEFERLSQFHLFERLPEISNFLESIIDLHFQITSSLGDSDLESVDELIDMLNQEEMNFTEKVIINTSVSFRYAQRKRGKSQINDKPTNIQRRYSFNEMWDKYVYCIKSDRSTRTLIDQEHDEFANDLYNKLTKKSSDEIVQGIKTFLAASVFYLYNSNKENSSTFVLMFTFKIHCRLLELSFNEIGNVSEHKEKRINSNIVNSFDTPRVSFMIYSILTSLSNEEFAYSHNVFNITCRFLSNLLKLRPESLQTRFIEFFNNDQGSQNLFSQCNSIIEQHMNVLKKGTMRSFYSYVIYTDHLSMNSYIIDDNLEKQVLILVRLLCSNNNKEMQSIMRDQQFNPKSYDLVTTISKYVSEFKTYLNFKITYDVFQTALDTLSQLVQGPNTANQDIVLQNHFVELSCAILRLDYRDGKETGKQPLHAKKKEARKFMYLSARALDKENILENEEHSELIDEIQSKMHSPLTNYMTSLIKYKCISVLLHLLSGREPSSYVHYMFRRILGPDVFRLNFAYQDHFIKKFHKEEYTLDMFFKYERDLDEDIKSPLIIELGFNLYFLLMHLNDNLINDMDKVYYKRLTSLIPLRDQWGSENKNA